DGMKQTIAVVMQTEGQRALLAQYGECVLMDFTHNTNNLGFYLGSLAITSPIGRGIPAADFICLNQQKATMTAIFEHIKTANPAELSDFAFAKVREEHDHAVIDEATTMSSEIAAGYRVGSSQSGGSVSSGSPASRSAQYKNPFTSSRVDESSEFEFSEFEDDFRDASVISSPVSKLSTAAVSSIAEQDVVSTSKKERAALPKILAVGRVPGTVEDMIYGILTPTETVSRMKEVYVHDEIADCRILHEIKGATPADPLRFLGLKWIIKAHSPLIGSLVRQRDFVFVESLGMRTRADGSRFGYFVMHSVEVPECGELSQYSIVRGQLSLVYILTQSSHGQADVFMKTYVELNGTLPDVVGVRTAANSLVTIALTNICGHKRKLGWAATKKLRAPAPRSSTPLLSSDASCSNCRKRFSRISTASVCFFCAARACSKCCEQREVVVPNPSAKSSPTAKLITKMSVVTCTRCYSTVFRNQPAEDVAREEVLAGEYGSVPRDDGKVPPNQQQQQSSTMSAGAHRRSLDIADLQHLTISRQNSQEPMVGYHSAAQLMGYHGQGYNGAAPLPLHMAYAGQQQQPRSYGAPPPQPSSDEDLYTRIAKLNQTAEQVYQYTKRTGDNSLTANGAPMTRS
ncbi:hypothetical protein PybrP1_002726, partial [[Pythium] brassicae (nom. inval.)]